MIYTIVQLFPTAYIVRGMVILSLSSSDYPQGEAETEVPGQVDTGPFSTPVRQVGDPLHLAPGSSR